MPGGTAARSDAPRRWDVVDHALQRRAVLRDVFAGRATALDVCDASPFLQRAAKEWGRRTEAACPVCRRDRLWEISWAYGEALGDGDGTARSAAGVLRLAAALPAFSVYEVEVCPQCGWNHLVRTYRTGTPGTQPRRRTRERARD